MFSALSLITQKQACLRLASDHRTLARYTGMLTTLPQRRSSIINRSTGCELLETRKGLQKEHVLYLYQPPMPLLMHVLSPLHRLLFLMHIVMHDLRHEIDEINSVPDVRDRKQCKILLWRNCKG